MREFFGVLFFACCGESLFSAIVLRELHCPRSFVRSLAHSIRRRSHRTRSRGIEASRFFAKGLQGGPPAELELAKSRLVAQVGPLAQLSLSLCSRVLCRSSHAFWFCAYVSWDGIRQAQPQADLCRVSVSRFWAVVEENENPCRSRCRSLL